MITVINSTTTTTIDNAADLNADRQTFMREFFHTARNNVGAERLDETSLFSERDLSFFRGLYGGYTKRDGTEVPGFLTKKSQAFPMGVQGEVEKLKSDREILKTRKQDLSEKDLRRYLYVIGHMQKLQAVVACLDRAILKRKVDQAEKAAPVIAPVIKQGVIRQGAVWVKDRDVTKAEALEIADLTEEKLLSMLKDSKIHSSSVLCIYSDRERLSFEKNGAAIRYIIEKRS